MAQAPATAIAKGMACCLLVLLVFFSRHSQVEGQAAECNSVRNCSECLDVAVQCQWCSDELDYWEGRRCQASFASTRPCTNIITFQSSVSITMNEAFSNDVQVRPQLVKANLRSQGSIQFTATVNPSRNYPLDVYYLMDHSFSMRDDLAKMKQFASGISSAIDSLTSNYRLGYGSFVDKPSMPFVVTDEQNIITPCLGCKLPYAFQNSLKLGNDSSLFNLTINADTISGNWDTPEGTFDALIQAAVCKDIGWRTNSRRVLLIATDAASHTAGEGRLLGINRPNDGLCHLDSKGFFTDFSSSDFPSISYTAYIFQRERILPIFMTTKYIQSWYSLAANQMRATGARVVQLDDDSANVIQLLSAELERLVRVARMIVLPQSGVNISVVATCPDGNQSTTDPTTGFQQCTNLGFDKMATFNITLTGLKCSNLRGLKSVVVRFVGYGDITVDITSLCQCPCEQAPVINSAFCASQGSSACGVCNCNSGFRDKTNTSRCDCNTNNNSPCVQPGTSTGVCNGRGECVCQECQCLPPANALISNAAYSGQYCECDNFNCPIASTGAICGGSMQGRCVCGKCQCLSGFTGNDCGCPLSPATCMRSDSLCSGVGNCSCGQCQCTAGYGGDFCEECSNIETYCEIAARCFNCTNEPQNGRCQSDCPGVNPEESTEDMPTINGMVASQCEAPISVTGCSTVFYFARNTAQGTRCNHPFFQFRLKQCPVPEALNYIPVTVGPALALLVIGLLLLILIKGYVYYRDRVEFRNFAKEAERARSDQKGVNPIYREAKQTFVNPEYQGKVEKSGQKADY